MSERVVPPVSVEVFLERCQHQEYRYHCAFPSAKWALIRPLASAPWHPLPAVRDGGDPQITPSSASRSTSDRDIPSSSVNSHSLSSP